VKKLVVGAVVLCVLGIAVLGITIRPDAPRVLANGGPIITETAPLFNLDGTYNADLVAELVYLAENAGRGAPNLHVSHTGVSGITVSDAGHIRTANDGFLPDIRLFEPYGTFSTDGMPSHGSINNQSRDNFTHSRWRLVYITHPDGGGDPVFTFRMIEAFRNNRIHDVGPTPGDPFWGVDTRYENSDIRANLTDEFNNVLDLFDEHYDIHRHFVAPGNLPGLWQNNQPDVGTPINQAMEVSARNDLLWLPSAYEVAGSSNQDLWRLTAAERSHVQNGFAVWAWLRSAQGTNFANARRTEALGTEMRNDANLVSVGQAIVPALHLSLSDLVNNPVFDITTQINPSGQSAGTITVQSNASLIELAPDTQRTLTANPSAGFRFTHWTTTSGTIASANNATTLFTLGSANATVTAHFQAYVTADGQDVDITATVYEVGHLNVPTAPSGHVFAGWVLYGTTVILPNVHTLTAGQVFEPVFDGYVMADGEQVILSTSRSEVSHLVRVTAVPADHVFAGWVLDGTTAILDNDRPLAPGEAFVPFFRGYVMADGVQVIITSIVHEISHLTSPTAIPQYHVFVGWVLDGTSTVLAENVALVAGMEIEPIFRGYVTANGVQVVLSPGITQVSHLLAPAAQTGREFINWGAADDTVLVPGMVFTAVWQDFITVNGVRQNITAEVYQVSHLTEPTSQEGRIFAGWALYGTTTVLADDAAITAGMVLVPMFDSVSTDTDLTWVWIGIAIAVALVLLVGGAFIVRRKLR